MIIDMHLHTNKSDGVLSPAELLDYIMRVCPQIELISVTDHDNVGAYDEIYPLPAKYPFKLVTGIEFSTFLDDVEYHVLGYGLDVINPDFRREVDTVRGWRRQRNTLMLDRLDSLGIRLDRNLFDDDKQSQGRYLMAKEIVKKHYAPTVDAAFNLYLNPGRPAYVQFKKLTPVDAISIIHKYNGVAVLAHAFSLKTATPIVETVDKLVKSGLDGLECYYPTFTADNTKTILSIAAKYNLLVTGGSDFHNAPREIGVNILS